MERGVISVSCDKPRSILGSEWMNLTCTYMEVREELLTCFPRSGVVRDGYLIKRVSA